MGRNGMGKTTTLRSIPGLTPARAGTIRFAGRHFLTERGRVVWWGASRDLAAAPDVQHRYFGV
jgi:ABC-type branched-subunit amino acid transport system ATPase component